MKEVEQLLAEVVKFKALFNFNNTTPQPGEFLTHIRGNSNQFNSLRPYDIGDDFRHIDWNTTAKKGSLYIKEFERNTSRTLLIVLDRSKAMNFHSRGKTKKQIAATIAGFYANSYLQTQSKVAFLAFDKENTSFLKESSQKKRLIEVISRSMMNLEQADLIAPIFLVDKVLGVARAGTDILLISDFINKEQYLGDLNKLRLKHNTRLVKVVDELECNSDLLGNIAVTDIEQNKGKFVISKSVDKEEVQEALVNLTCKTHNTLEELHKMCLNL